jgi:exodeoxyribonuclease V gamma subunit
MQDAHSGIAIYRASRLESLLVPLLTLLDQIPPDNVLAPQTIIAAHPGMKQWLSGALARKRGLGAIAANLDIVLPSDWLDQLAQRVLGESAVALTPYRRDRLRWRIHECLDGLQAPQVQAYLHGSDVARRRFQLADRLARIYTQYLVYRPDWLDAWARGREPLPKPESSGFIAPLWRQLREQIGQPHRGERFQALVDALHAGALPNTEPLHVFGISHLAPSELAVLRAVARKRLVVLYVPDPCREYWSGLRRENRKLRELIKADAFSTATEAQFLDQDHPLLAAWGRMGQHFMLALEDSQDDIVLDLRDWNDELDTPQLDSRLHCVQESIRQLDPTLMAPQGDVARQLQDRSLRVHACHTRLRELEVLRDALLRELKEDKHLKPADIVVMAPDIRAYVPLIPAVFGEAGKHAGPLPYHLADVAVARGHSLFEAFRQLLDLPQSRLTAPEVVDLLAVPEIARRLNIGEDDLATLTRWLANTRVAWGLDGNFRESFGVPGINEHTFAWGMDRLLAGYVLGQAGDAENVGVLLPDHSELAPVEGIAGPQAELLGALDRLLVQLAAWREAAKTPKPASQWALFLEQRCDAMFMVDSRDRDAREAGSQLLRFIRGMALETADSGVDPELDYSVVREVLLERLSVVPERQRFLMGGVTFCGMIVQRAIPFGVVAVLGLNDGEFPRAPSDSGLDLMARHRRLGDRDVCSDDRYLFLETLMSARTALHLSYIGEGVRDGKPRNPAAPLAELLAALDEHAGLHTPGHEKTDRPWRVKHPLQPFDARYFDGSDPRLFSFSKAFQTMVKSDRDAPARFLETTAASFEPSAQTGETRIPLREVLAFYKDPARQVLSNRLNIRLDALDEDQLSDSEPLQARFEHLDNVAKRLFMHAAENNLDALPAQIPAWLRLTGLLPPGRVGKAAWDSEADGVDQLLAQARTRPLFQGGLPGKAATPIQTRLGDYHVEGALSRAYAKDGGLWVLDVFPNKKTEAALDFKQRIGFFIEWALLRLAMDTAVHVRAVVLVLGGEHPWQDGINAWDEAFVNAELATRAGMENDLRQRLLQLFAFWSAAQQRPAWFFPRTSWAAVTDVSGDGNAATQAWAGGHESNGGERDYSPGYAHLLAGDRRFEADEPDYDALLLVARRLLELIHFSPVHADTMADGESA